MQLADRKEPGSSLSKALTMHETRFNSSMATIGKAEPSRFEKTDMPTPEVDFKVVQADLAVGSVLEGASAVDTA